VNFDFSEEQVMLRDSVARFVQDQYDFDARCAVVANDSGFSAENWQTFAELGWLSIPFSEEHGGFGGNALDTMVVMEELGRGLVAEPFVATVLLFGGLIQAAGTSAQQEAWLPRIIGGEVQGAFAFLERQSRFELADVAATARADGDGYVLEGEKTVVFNGSAADTIIVSARTDGAQTDEAGIGLFIVDAADVEKTSYRLMDGQLVANIKLNGVKVGADALLGEAGAAFPVIQAVTNDVILALSAEALGIMGKLNATTLEYTKTREQFGVPISSFQALQHRMVDTFMAYEQTKSILYRAACSRVNESSEGGETETMRDLHALKVMVGKAGKLVGDEAIQMHGGMGLTDELDVGHYVKRLMMIRITFGDADHHQQKFNALSY
jgi:alkylation response protein AidB-like acyl-CoA dehydrogenase